MAESPFDNVKFPRFDELPFRKGDPDSKFGSIMNCVEVKSSDSINL